MKITKNMKITASKNWMTTCRERGIPFKDLVDGYKSETGRDVRDPSGAWAKDFVAWVEQNYCQPDVADSEYEYLKNNYCRAKREYEKRGEEDNNDVLTREDKMHIARGQLDEYVRKHFNASTDEVQCSRSWQSAPGPDPEGKEMGIYVPVNYATHKDILRIGYLPNHDEDDTVEFYVMLDDPYLHNDWEIDTGLLARELGHPVGYERFQRVYPEDIQEIADVIADYFEVEISEEAFDEAIAALMDAHESERFRKDTAVTATTDIKCADEWYFGKEKAEQLGDLIVKKLAGKTVSKRRDTAEEPGGLIFEADKLGINMWDLLEALEGLCYQGRAREINDSTYKVLG